MMMENSSIELQLGKVEKHFLIYNVHKNMRSKSTMEHSFVGGVNYYVNITSSKSSICGSIQNIGLVLGYGLVGKGNKLCLEKGSEAT